MPTSIYSINPNNFQINGGGSGITPSGFTGTVAIGQGITAGSNGISITGSMSNIELRLEKIEERLCILKPDPEKLAKYEALKDLYSQYKMMEALLTDYPK